MYDIVFRSIPYIKHNIVRKGRQIHVASRRREGEQPLPDLVVAVLVPETLLVSFLEEGQLRDQVYPANISIQGYIMSNSIIFEKYRPLYPS